MVLTIGQMRSSVTFLANSPTVSATATREAVTTGGLNDVYVILLVTRGRLRKKSGHRNLDFGLIQSAESYELICRFQSALENNLRVDTKIIIDDKTYTLNSWEKVEEINHLYKFDLNTSSEQIAAGSYPGIGIGEFIVS